MALRVDALMAHDFGTVRQHYGARDTILYALGVGLGRNPADPSDIHFLDETRLQVLPTFGVTLATPGMWIRNPEFGVDFTKLVHLSQAAWFPNRLPAEAEITGTARVASLTDRGPGRGAVLVVERQIKDAETGATYCHLLQTLLLRGDGGFGGAAAPRLASLIPDSAPDVVYSFETSPRAALIYRLSGDLNPLHIDPDTAQRAGFDRPILHGLASYGIAGVAVSRALGQNPATVAYLTCRFASVVMPGDSLTFEVWKTDASAVFRAVSGDRKLLDEGQIEWNLP